MWKKNLPISTIEVYKKSIEGLQHKCGALPPQIFHRYISHPHWKSHNWNNLIKFLQLCLAEIKWQKYLNEDKIYCELFRHIFVSSLQVTVNK